MSGYSLVVVDASDADTVTALFRPDETTVRDLPHGRRLILVSNCAAVTDAHVFQGYGIDHDAESMIFPGAERPPSPERPIEGSYVTVRFEPDAVRVGADIFGFVPMLWTSEPRVTAVSDSYLALIAIRRALGLACTADEETILGRMWLNAMSWQQIGCETYCREIRYALPGTELRFAHASGHLTRRPMNLQVYYEQNLDSHAAAVRISGVRMVRVLKTFAAAGGTVGLALSGGTDSRLCLAAALAADIDDILFVGSRENDSEDYRVSVELGERFGFALNDDAVLAALPLAPYDEAAGWAGSSLGLSDALYMPTHYGLREVPNFAVGGHGAGLTKGAFGWRPVSAIGMPHEGHLQSWRALTEMGVEREDRWGSEWHYLAFRNAIHGGRAGLSTDYISRPSAQIPLIGLSRSPLNELPAPSRVRPTIIHDALIALSPQLASHRFDDRRKNLTPDYVEERLARLGGPIPTADLTPYAVVGTPAPFRGYLASHIALGQRFGLTGTLDPRTLWPLVRTGLDRFASLVAEPILDRLSGIDTTSQTRLSGSSREAGAVGKMIALTTVH